MNSKTSIAHVEASLCFNFPGNQTYYTMSWGGAWNGNGYTDFGPQYSPTLVY